MLWIGVADRSAGIADDLVLGFDGLVVGHQFKTAKFPATFTIETLLTGADVLLKPLVSAWQSLRKTDPGSRVEVRLVVSDYPSIKDKPGDATPAHSAAFLDEFERFPDRSLHAWRATNWSRLIELLRQASGLEDVDFERFLNALRVMHGAAADFVQFHKLSAEKARLAAEIANVLPKLVTDARDKDRWSREELLHELGWRDPAKTRHVHRFPVGAYVQRILDTEHSLQQALRAIHQGYVALVGPPGSGKSTLLQMALATEPNVRLVRYLAFMPGAAQGVGRGEADDFLEDVAAQMRNGGLLGLRLRDSSQHERREQFGALLKQAGERYERDGVRTIIVVDGLDHVPREERPTHSLLAELPLPAAVPTGVTFVLGTQRLDLEHLKPAVQDQAAKSGQLVTMRPLSRDAVGRMADALGLDPAVSRQRLNELCHGHPLATRYLIRALLCADEPRDLARGRDRFRRGHRIGVRVGLAGHCQRPRRQACARIHRSGRSAHAAEVARHHRGGAGNRARTLDGSPSAERNGAGLERLPQQLPPIRHLQAAHASRERRHRLLPACVPGACPTGARYARGLAAALAGAALPRACG